MLKRTMGRSLLGLLVITGLAGTINNNSLSKSERKTAVSLLKETRSDLSGSVKDLSNHQLNYRISADKQSIKEQLYHLTLTEKNLWAVLENTMKKAANPEKRTEVRMTDEQLINFVEKGDARIKLAAAIENKKPAYRSVNEALSIFKNRRAAHIKYMKSTTEDMRNHVVQMTFGWIDCYQLCLMIAARSNRTAQQINEIKTDTGFPEQ